MQIGQAGTPEGTRQAGPAVPDPDWPPAVGAGLATGVGAMLTSGTGTGGASGEPLATGRRVVEPAAPAAGAARPPWVNTILGLAPCRCTA
jgi:hypothetical protein